MCHPSRLVAKNSESNMKKSSEIAIIYPFLFFGARMAIYLGLWYMPSKISEHGVILWNELALPNEAKEVFTTTFQGFKDLWNVVGWIGVGFSILSLVLFHFDKIKIDQLSKLQKKLYINIIELLVLFSLFLTYTGFIVGAAYVTAGQRILIKALSKDFSIQIGIVMENTSCFKEQYFYILPSGIILLLTTVVILCRFKRTNRNFISE